MDTNSTAHRLGVIEGQNRVLIDQNTQILDLVRTEGNKVNARVSSLESTRNYAYGAFAALGFLGTGTVLNMLGFI